MAVAPEVIDYYRSITNLDATALAPLCEPKAIALDGMDFPLALHTLESTPGNWRTVQEKPRTPMQLISSALGRYIRPFVEHVMPEDTWGKEINAALDDIDPARHDRPEVARGDYEWHLNGPALSKDQLIGKKYPTGKMLGMTIATVLPPLAHDIAYTAEQTTKKGYRFSDPGFFFRVDTALKTGVHEGNVVIGLSVLPGIVYNTARKPVRSFRVYTMRSTDTLRPHQNVATARVARRLGVAVEHPMRGGDCSGDGS